MITKVVHGWRVGGLISYLMGPGRAQEHVRPRVIASWDGRDAAWQPAQSGAGEFDLELDPMIRALRAPAIAAGLGESDDQGKRGYVWHCSARVAAGDRVLTDAEWGEVARELLVGSGVAARSDAGGPRWVVVRHADDHIHIAVVLIRQDTCRRFWPSHDYPRLRTAAQQIEPRLGLAVTASADGTAARAPGRGEIEKARRQGRERSSGVRGTRQRVHDHELGERAGRGWSAAVGRPRPRCRRARTTARTTPRPRRSPPGQQVNEHEAAISRRAVSGIYGTRVSTRRRPRCHLMGATLRAIHVVTVTSPSVHQEAGMRHDNAGDGVETVRLHRVPEAMRLLSLSRSVIYELIRSGRLRSVTQGRTRLIPATALPSTSSCWCAKPMTARRSRGDGSVYWDEVRQRWLVSATIGYTPSGQRIRRRASGRTKTEARDRLREIIRDHEDGVTVSGSHSYTVAQAVTDWLDHGLGGRDPKTVYTLGHLARRHVIPALGARKLRELSAEDVDRWLAEKSRVLSTSTVARVKSILARSITRAQARDKVKRNVVLLCGTPTGRGGRPSQAMTFDQAQALLDAAPATTMGAYAVVSLLTGARTEELRALTWSHVDLTGDPDSVPPVPPNLRVWRSVRAGGDTKTRGSRRTIALPERCVDALTEHRVRQFAARTTAGEDWVDHDLVFATEAGTAMDAANVRRDFQRVAVAAGLDERRWSPRELRHSFVSLLSDGGVPIEQIARQIGHAGGSKVTESVYRKQLRPVIDDGAIAMNRVFPRRGVRPSVGPSELPRMPRRPGQDPQMGL